MPKSFSALSFRSGASEDFRPPALWELVDGNFFWARTTAAQEREVSSS
jgi:hypothetical protein